MADSNLELLLQPDAGDEINARVNEICRIIEDVLALLEAVGNEIDIRDLLARLLLASGKLAELGNFILKGSDRHSMQGQLAAIERMIVEVNERLNAVGYNARRQ